jgi:hypothetical protein
MHSERIMSQLIAYIINIKHYDDRFISDCPSNSVGGRQHAAYVFASYIQYIHV